MTAHRAVTTEAPPWPNGAGGETEENQKNGQVLPMRLIMLPARLSTMSTSTSGVSFHHYSRSIRQRSRAKGEQSYGSFGRFRIIFGSAFELASRPQYRRCSIADPYLSFDIRNIEPWLQSATGCEHGWTPIIGSRTNVNFGFRWHCWHHSGRSSGRRLFCLVQMSLDRWPPRISDPQHWHKRATQARGAAETITDPVLKRMMLEVAAGYERLAKRAEERWPKLKPTDA
jgi:hypothetical protein